MRDDDRKKIRALLAMSATVEEKADRILEFLGYAPPPPPPSPRRRRLRRRRGGVVRLSSPFVGKRTREEAANRGR